MPVETKPSGGLFQSVLGGDDPHLEIPEGDHTLRLGFLDDPFVKTIAAADVYKDTVKQVDQP